MGINGPRSTGVLRWHTARLWPLFMALIFGVSRNGFQLHGKRKNSEKIKVVVAKREAATSETTVKIIKKNKPTPSKVDNLKSSVVGWLPERHFGSGLVTGCG